MSDITVTVSGSFHRPYISAVIEAVRLFKEKGIRVLSPSDPRIVDSIGQFVFVASDLHRSVRLVQDRHLASISQSTFLWLVAPDGYVGQSASLELGFAIAFGIPIFCNELPSDLTLSQYVTKVDGIDEAIDIIRKQASIIEEAGNLLLVDPLAAITTAHQKLEKIGHYLNTPSSKNDGDLIAESLVFNIDELKRLISLTPHQK